MNDTTVLHMASQALVLIAELAGPVLVVSLVVGLVVSLFQAGTRMNDLTMHFVPRLLAIMLVIAMAGAWVGGRMTDYVRNSAAAMVSTLE